MLVSSPYAEFNTGINVVTLGGVTSGGAVAVKLVRSVLLALLSTSYAEYVTLYTPAVLGIVYDLLYLFSTASVKVICSDTIPPGRKIVAETLLTPAVSVTF